MLYFSIYILILISALNEKFVKKIGKNQYISNFILLILFLLVGFRYYVGTDYNSYIQIFNNSEFIYNNGNLEFGFRFFNTIFYDKEKTQQTP